jgi:benzodiazapine receptor
VSFSKPMQDATKKMTTTETKTMTPGHSWLGLIVLVTICFAAAGIGGAVTTPKIDNWYATLTKPSWNPPNWVFGPVWSALYLGMAVAAWLVWRQGGLAGAAWPLVLFGVQLVLNVLWSCLFFGLRNPFAAFVEVLALWVAIAATMVAFWLRATVAGILFVPYLAWVSFASALNFAIWRLNV